jgi:hypothetical protein
MHGKKRIKKEAEIKWAKFFSCIIIAAKIQYFKVICASLVWIIICRSTLISVIKDISF